MNRFGVRKEVVEPVTGDLRDLEGCPGWHRCGAGGVRGRGRQRGRVSLVLAVVQPLPALLDDPVERLRVACRPEAPRRPGGGWFGGSAAGLPSSDTLLGCVVGSGWDDLHPEHLLSAAEIAPGEPPKMNDW
jgi:hypothetical protein